MYPLKVKDELTETESVEVDKLRWPRTTKNYMHGENEEDLEKITAHRTRLSKYW